MISLALSTQGKGGRLHSELSVHLRQIDHDLDHISTVVPHQLLSEAAQDLQSADAIQKSCC